MNDIIGFKITIEVCHTNPNNNTCYERTYDAFRLVTIEIESDEYEMEVIKRFEYSAAIEGVPKC